MMRKPNAFELNPEQAVWNENVLNQWFSWIKEEVLDQPVFMQNLIVNILAQPHKCLILSKDTKISNQLSKALQAQNLNDFGLVLTEHLGDDFFNQIEQLGQKKKNEKNFDPQYFDANYAHLLRLHLQLRKKYLALRTPVFTDLNWPDLVGLALLSQTELGNEPLNLVLSQDDFSFTPEELHSLLELLHQGQQLYEEVVQKDHPLKALHSHIFLQKNLPDAQLFSRLKLAAYQQRVNSLIQKFQQRLSTYSQLLREHLEQKIKSFLIKLDHILDQIEEKGRKYGQKYLGAKTGKTKWYASLSSQGKLETQDYRQIKADYQVLQKNFEETQWFNFNWPNPVKLTTLNAIKTTLEAFESTLKTWQAGLWRFIQEEELRLNAKFALPELAQTELIIALEEEMEELIGDLNETQLLNVKLEHNMLTLLKRKQYLSQIQQQLEHMAAHLEHFPAFYQWQRFWLTQQELHQELMRKLIEAKATRWDTSFKVWYWRQVVYRTRQKDLPNEGSHNLQLYHQWWNQYKQLLPDQIIRLKTNDNWRRSAINHFKDLKKRSSSTPVKSWQELGWITHLYPIVMLNKWDAATLAGMGTQQIFDWVLVTEHPNSEELLKLYQNVGKQVVVFEQKTAATEVEPRDIIQIDSLKVTAQEGFWASFAKAILPYFGAQRIERSVQLAGMVLPLVLKPEQEGKPGFVFLQDGFLSTLDVTDFAWEAARQEKLREAGWELIYVWSEECWKNLHETCRKIAAEIIRKEK